MTRMLNRAIIAVLTAFTFLPMSQSFGQQVQALGEGRNVRKGHHCGSYD